MINRILLSIKYKFKDFLIFVEAFFKVVWECKKDGIYGLPMAVLIYLFASVPFVLASFVTCFLTKGSITGMAEDIKELEKETCL